MELKEVISKMKNCYQIEGKQTILQHGYMVFNYTIDLINHLKHGTPLKYTQRVPDFMYEYKDQIINNLVDFKTLKHYTILHDCGKPYCKPDS